MFEPWIDKSVYGWTETRDGVQDKYVYEAAASAAHVVHYTAKTGCNSYVLYMFSYALWTLWESFVVVGCVKRKCTNDKV